MTATPERDKGHSFERSNVGSRRRGDAPMDDQESGSKPSLGARAEADPVLNLTNKFKESLVGIKP